MLIFTHKRLAILAMPKTGTTALENALIPRADIVFGRQRKHMNARQFYKRVDPFLRETYDVEVKTLAVMRAPIDHLSSWYRYRTRDFLLGSDRSTARMSFDQFVTDGVLADPRPEFAQFGSQWNFLIDRDGKLNVDHLFAYENQTELLAFLSEKLKTGITLRQENVSPKVATTLTKGTKDRLHIAFRDEFSLYDRLVSAGGYLTRD